MPGADPDWVEQNELKKRQPEHGFKAHAKRQSAALRQKYGWSADERIDCFDLAEAMGISISRLTEHEEREAVEQLVHHDPSCFSAATLHLDGATRVILNDTHNPERQTSNLAHEIGHVWLAHEEAPFLSDAGCRELDVVVEVEAAYFGSVLLVSDAAVLRLARSGLTIPESAAELGVSTQMMQWRYNDSGAARRLKPRPR